MSRAARSEPSGWPATERRVQGLARRPVAVLSVTILLELAIALPFLRVSPDSVRGIPAPTMLVVAVLAAFLLGARLGALAAAVAAVLAVTIVGEHAVSAPVWVVLAALMGMLGDRYRRAEHELNRLQYELQSNLLPPSLALEQTPLRIARRYKPAEQRLLLGGDFYALGVTADGETAVMVGDVAGHGARQAAVGVALRAAWRAMTLSGSAQADVLAALNALVVDEQRRTQRGDELFATVTCMRLRTDSLSVATAGHVPAFVLRPEGVQRVEPAPGPPLGAVARASWPEVVVELGDEWSVMLFSDGLIEGFAAPGARERFGIERLEAILARRHSTLMRESDIEDVVREVEAANGGPLADDLVVLTLSPAAQPARSRR